MGGHFFFFNLGDFPGASVDENLPMMAWPSGILWRCFEGNQWDPMWASLIAQLVKNLPAMQETLV